MKEYLFRVLIGLDLWIATMMNDGLPGQTLSGRAGLAQRRGKVWGCVLCRFLDLFDKNHCEKSVAADIARAGDVIKDR